MDGLDLKAFLEQQTMQGTVDSEGSFTVAREKALQKLNSFALPGEFDWVLKIVQAANVLEAPRLVVRQTRVATSFYFCPGQAKEFPTETALLEALNSLTLERDDPMHQLAMALRSLVQQSRLSFVLAVRHQGELCKPIYAGDDVSRLDSGTREAWTSLKVEGVRLTVSHFTGDESYTGRYLPTFTKQTRRDLGILQALESRCFASPTAIEIDGRLVTLVFPRGDFFTTHKLRPLLLGRLSRDSGTGALQAELQPVSPYLPRQRLRVTAQDQRKSAWLSITAPDWRMHNLAFRSASRLLTPATSLFDRSVSSHDIWWVRHGVVVARLRAPSDPANQTRLSLFLPAEDLRSDLSGLQIEQEAQHQTAQEALGAIENALVLGVSTSALREGLLLHPEPSAKLGQEQTTEAIEQAGDSAATRSLFAFELPAFGLGLLALADRAAEFLAQLPLHEARLKIWADASHHRLEFLTLEIREGGRRLISGELA